MWTLFLQLWKAWIMIVRTGKSTFENLPINLHWRCTNRKTKKNQ
jgi:hypothetical protein